MKNNPVPVARLLMIFSAILISMGFLSVYDYELTVWIQSANVEEFSRFVDQSLFSDDPFGASDIGVIYALLAVILYLVLNIRSISQNLLYLRPLTGFIAFASLFNGLILVHSFKIMMGRARPESVLDGETFYSGWYEFGPHLFSQGYFSGSFPSGHTATSILLITLSYILIGSSGESFTKKILGYAWGVLALFLSVAIAVGRVMSGHHWITDCVGTMLIGWFLIHCFYYYILRVPEQVKAVTLNLNFYQKFCEMKLLGLVCPIAISFVGFSIAIRTLAINFSLSYLALAGGSLLFSLICIRKLAAFYQNTFCSFTIKP